MSLLRLDIRAKGQEAPELDFCLVALPRSGSHMLASALDGHPEIDCFGEHRVPQDGTRHSQGIMGKLVHGTPIPAASKYIFLYREPLAIQASRLRLNRDGLLHEYREGDTIYARDTSRMPSGFIDAIRAEREEVLAELEGTDHIIVSYESLCAGQDTEALNAEQATRICRFLGVAERELRPKTRKANG